MSTTEHDDQAAEPGDLVDRIAAVIAAERERPEPEPVIPVPAGVLRALMDWARLGRDAPDPGDAVNQAARLLDAHAGRWWTRQGDRRATRRDAARVIMET